MDVLGIRRGIEALDMVAMKGEGVVGGGGGVGSVGNSSSSGVQSVGNGGGGSGNGGTDNLAANIQCPQDCHSNGTNGEAQWKILSQDSGRMNKIRDIVESSASMTSKSVVDNLLQQVNQLSDVEKFLLYLKLPVGRPPDTDPLKHAPPLRPLNPLGSRCEIQLTINWIRTHLEMNSEVSLPKREVYDEYMHYCNLNNIKALSTADFGKVMKQVFPGVRPRRLGQRGASKYCYSGLRKKWGLAPPDLPDLSLGMGKGLDSGGSVLEEEGEVERAASSLVLEWAEKLCSVKFESVRDLALHLVHKNYVDNRSVAAFTLLSLADHKQGVVMSSGVGGGGKHRETQMQLQRKLQEREHIREQKRKLQEHQPGVGRCKEGPKARRRSGASRHPSGDPNNNPNLPNGTPTLPNLPNGTPTTPTKLSPPINPPSTTSNGTCDVGLGMGLGLVNGGEVVPSLTNIKQEQEHHFDFLDSLIDDNKISAKLVSGAPTFSARKSSCPTLGGGADVRKAPNMGVGGGKPALAKTTPTKKTFIYMPSVSKPTSPKYKAIQPKTGDSVLGGVGTLMGGIGGGMGGSNMGGGVIPQWTDMLNSGTVGSDDKCFPRTDVMCSGLRELQPQQTIQPPPLQGIGTSNMSGGLSNISGQEAEDELSQCCNKGGEIDDIQKNTQLSELRKLLQRNLPATPAQGGSGNRVGDMLEPDPGAGCMRRRVSFQPALDVGDTLNPLVGGQTVGSVPPSPNTRRTQFNFMPITSVDQPQGASQCSSANASPFMSPRNTPLPRSRHNSGQTNSTYVTPRSTPFTPDQPSQLPTSETGTPFMSPITTPLFPRSRHNSSQNIRTPYTPTCRSRHSSGAPTFRHNPYPCEDGSGRRGGKFRSRHSSGSVPQSPSSAPLSPMVQDGSLLGHHDSTSMLHHMLKSKPQAGQGQVGSGMGQGMSNEMRRRHMSAGPTIHYQSQPPPFPADPLSQEVSSVLTSAPSGPPGNRPQSVPLLQMLNQSACPEAFPKSQPNTPLTGQQFTFVDVLGPSQSYAPTPVPSEYSDFPLDIDPLLDVGLTTGPSPVTLDSIEALPQSAVQPPDLSALTDPLNVPPNINPFSSDFRNDGVGGDSGSCLVRVEGMGGDGGPQEPLLGSNSMLTLNELNRPTLSLEISGSGVGLEEDFQPTLSDLGDQEVFNSLVLDVNKD